MLKKIVKKWEEIFKDGNTDKDLAADMAEIYNGLGLIPFFNINATGTCGLYDVGSKRIVEGELSERGFYRSVKQMFEDSKYSPSRASELLDQAILINKITMNPFESREFIADDNDSKVKRPIYTLNAVRYDNAYYNKLKPIKGDKDIDLMLKSIRLNDETQINNEFVFTEVIFAWQFFHTSKVMAIPCLYGGQGLGKTTLSMAGEYLYHEKGHNHVTTVNVASKNAAQWGDHELFARLVTYDDIPANKQIVEEVSSTIKSISTRDGSRSVNIKGKSKVESNSFNIAVTTNNIDGIPIDKSTGEDRRIYPIHIKSEDWSPDEVRKIKQLEIPISGNRDKHYPLIQKILNHLYYVYQQTKDNREVQEFLLKKVPMTAFKARIITGTSNKKKLFPNIVSTSHNINELITSLSNDFDTSFDFLKNRENATIIKVRGNYFLSLNSKGLVLLGMAIDSQKGTAISVFNRHFKKEYEFKVQKVEERKNEKCIRFAMKNYKTN